MKTKNPKATRDMKIVTAKYNPKVKESVKRKEHPSGVNAILFCVNESFHETDYIYVCNEYLHNLVL